VCLPNAPSHAVRCAAAWDAGDRQRSCDSLSIGIDKRLCGYESLKKESGAPRRYVPRVTGGFPAVVRPGTIRLSECIVTA